MRIQAGMTRTVCQDGQKTEPHSQTFVFPSNAAALFYIKEYLR